MSLVPLGALSTGAVPLIFGLSLPKSLEPLFWPDGLPFEEVALVGTGLSFEEDF